MKGYRLFIIDLANALCGYPRRPYALSGDAERRIAISPPLKVEAALPDPDEVFFEFTRHPPEVTLPVHVDHPEARTLVAATALLRARDFQIPHRAPVALERPELNAPLGDVFRDVFRYALLAADRPDIDDWSADKFSHLRGNPALRDEG